jgi:hypothetical protein
MKGVVFNLLEQFITRNLGDEKYEEILAESQLKTKEPFVGPGTYPDEDLVAIVERTAGQMGVSLPEVLHAFGRFCFPELAERFPLFIEPYNHPKPFLKTIDSIIHMEVKKLLIDAQPPRFTYEEPATDSLVIKYSSRRKLCHFMEGLIDGVADFYKSPNRYGHKSCMLDGDEVCELHLTLLQEGS